MFLKGISGESGEVVAIHGDRATVKVPSNKACNRCRICKRISSTEMIVDAYTLKPVQIGEKVVLGFRPGVIVQSAFILYLIPLICLVLGYFAGRWIFRSFVIPEREELLPALCALAFLFGSFIPIRYYDKRKQGDTRFRVYIKERK